MSTFTFKLPDVGEGVVEAEIVEWHVKPGDTIEEDQNLVDIMTDKATVEISSPVAGVVDSVTGEPGDMIAVGSPLAVFRLEGAPPAEEMAKAPPKEEKPAKAEQEDKAPARGGKTEESARAPLPASGVSAPRPAAAAPPAPVKRDGRPLASPAVRRRAREAQVDLALVQGSGPAGRIGHDDLDAFIAGGGRLSGAPARTRQTGTHEVKVIGLRRRIAEKMTTSNDHIPHFGYVEEVDMEALEDLRRHLNHTRREGQPKLTPLPFLMQAMVRAIREFPQINATFDDEAGVVTRHDGVHLGIATQTDNGLMVPVVRHAEALDVWECAAEVARLSAAARDGTATREDLQGSTITITSLGAMGGIATMPIINHPEVGIIGVNKLEQRPVVRDGVIVVRRMMNLSSCFDHRVVDGYEGAQFVQRLKALLEYPATIFM